MGYLPLVIIGAPRSGTNMLRGVLTQLPGVATWPCDEINYIWRHGNTRYPSDELTPVMARPRVRRYIQRQFNWVARRSGAAFVVEKTCANSLRVPFVDTVMPEARYIFIRRSGLDAVGSAIERWKAALDISYLVRKARFVPVIDLPYYGGRYLWNRAYRLFSREQRLAYWGPQLDGMAELLAEHSLEEVCALQWRRCVESAEQSFAAMAREKWMEVVYEDFVQNPQRELARVVEFVGIKADDVTRRKAVAGVSAANIGKGRAALGEEMAGHLEQLLGKGSAKMHTGALPRKG